MSLLIPALQDWCVMASAISTSSQVEGVNVMYARILATCPEIASAYASSCVSKRVACLGVECGGRSVANNGSALCGEYWLTPHRQSG